MRLGLEGFELFFAELLSLGVGEQAIGGAGDVAQVTGDGHQAERLALDFGIGEALGPLLQIFDSKLERMENGAARGRDVGVCAAHPRFNVRFWNRIDGHGKPWGDASRARDARRSSREKCTRWSVSHFPPRRPGKPFEQQSSSSGQGIFLRFQVPEKFFDPERVKKMGVKLRHEQRACPDTAQPAKIFQHLSGEFHVFV